MANDSPKPPNPEQEPAKKNPAPASKMHPPNTSPQDELSPDPDMETLRAHLESLPVELYDMIFDFTFTAVRGVRDLGYILSHDHERTFCRISPSHPFLSPDTSTLLQISRATRIKFAASYYGGEGAVFLAYTMYAAQTWLKSLDQEFVDMIRDFRVLINVGYEGDSDDEGAQVDDQSSKRYCLQSIQMWFGGEKGGDGRARVFLREEAEIDESLKGYQLREFSEPPPKASIMKAGSWRDECDYERVICRSRS